MTRKNRNNSAFRQELGNRFRERQAEEATSLVERLREGKTEGSHLRWTVTPIHREAADEIERLRREIDRLNLSNQTVADELGCEIERLQRALADARRQAFIEAAEQIEWLKARLAWLQLPENKRDHDTREKWLLECGMPEAAAIRKLAEDRDDG